MLCWYVVSVFVVTFTLSSAHPFSIPAPRAACGYDSCGPIVADKLNVHMIPHTHDDVGWLKTLDQYFYGSRSNIQQAAVEYIIDSVVDSLSANPARRFIYVETAFLSKWWKDQTETKRDQVRGLVNSGQLEITNGAWSMNDEGAAHYHSIIDQFSWGFKVLDDWFGECGRPTVGWQIDPFGHSREHASIIARLGFDGVFFARLDYQDREKRLAEKTAEMIWRGSPDNLGDASDLFTHVFESHYSAPNGFCFDINCGDDPMIDDQSSPEYNIPDKVRAFTEHVKNKATKYRSNNVLLTMGDDFMYHEANVYFKNMDKVIKYVNAESESNMNVIYSTPACYLKAVNDEGLSWPEKTDDFFPYAQDSQSYYVGYFTSRATLKYFERLGNNFLQSSKHLLSLTGAREEAGLTQLREAMGVLQHHDAITGTMLDHVGQDYARILDSAIAASGLETETAINKLFGNTEPTLVPVISCLKLNISECAATEVQDHFVITVYNPLSRPVAEYIRVPITGTDYQVQHPDGTILPSNYVAIPGSVQTLVGRRSSASRDLLFRADSLPPLGFQSFYVTQFFRPAGGAEPKQARGAGRADTIGNNRITVNFDDSGLTQSININGIDVSLAQTFEFYIGAYKSGERASGAYCFRPNGTTTTSIGITNFTVVRTSLVEEVHQEFGGWVSQVIRVYKEENHVEFEWMVGPIPDNDDIGKEVISKYTTDLASEATFYTDSNGRELLKRVRDFRPTWDVQIEETIAANYYPVVSKILLRDETKGVEVAVLVDRSQGGSSIRDGEIELMVHRRLFHDDSFEPLNEVSYGVGTVARGKHWLVAGPIGGASPTTAAQERLAQAAKLLKPWTFVSPNNGLLQPAWAAKYNVEFSGLTGTGLPNNVQILTLEPWTQNTLLLRLEHILEVNEDDQLSLPVTIDLTTAFSQITINSAVETTLGGIQPIEELNRLQWNSEAKRDRTPRENKAVDITAVTLNPMEIRTFFLDYTLA